MTPPTIECPTDAPGYPDRSPDLDALPGFQNPPPGYGEAPFWWWTGDDLDVDRMLWQVRELHKKGISGFQVNYSHGDTLGWPSDSGEPKIFTKEWWEIYGRVSKECEDLNMGIGLSTYTLDWPNGADNLFYRLFYSKPELNAIELVAGERVRVASGVRCQVSSGRASFVRAYRIVDGVLQRGGIDLTELVQNGELSWTAPDGEWEVWTFEAVRREGTLNPLLPGAGDTVVQGFYQPFEDHNPGEGAEGLNYFFNDELKVGLGKFAWNPDFADEFRKRKGYDLLEVLPAMWEDMGDITPKVRIDYADVRMSLMEERYFEPIHNWHKSRGIIFGCDNEGRGLDPHAYGDYYRATRWYTAPGHDTPGGLANLLKGKVSSSIANLYGLPRVQLEGYHSLGWGATTERVMEATCQNFLYGCNLLSFHGCYYTTYGSHWEWAPPCYHWRMPYWEHMGTFLKYFERLSYLMSQGHHVCDVAVIYPVTPFEAEMNGKAACESAFDIATKLMGAGINFDFIDHQSLARATVDGDRLVIEDAGASYKVLIVPNMDAVRWESIEKAAAFTKAGGMSLVVGTLPSVSDRTGRNDSELVAMNEQAFKPECRLSTADESVALIQNAFVQDVCGLNGTVIAQHRKIGPRNVYMVMGANPGDVVEFRAKGAAELWDPWTGDSSPLRVVQQTETGTQLELPLETYEAQLVVFTPDEATGSASCCHPELVEGSQAPSCCKDSSTPLGMTGPVGARAVLRDLSDNEWRVRFEPTMDNRYGDFRLPVTPGNKTIGVEARRFAWARETDELATTAMLPETDDSGWQTQLHGYGPKMFLLGPVPETVDPAAIDAQLATLERVDPAVPVTIDGTAYHWQPYEFSWRYGKEDDPGHQGFHGLKETISKHFIRLGKRDRTETGAAPLSEDEHTRYYLWTTAVVDEPVIANVLVSEEDREIRVNHSPSTTPAAVYVNGESVSDLQRPVTLQAGANPVLVRFDNWGEAHVVLRREDVPLPEQPEQLAMRWYKDPGVIPFDVSGGDTSAEWFRFVSAPGTTAIQMQVDAGSGHANHDEDVSSRTDILSVTGSNGVVTDGQDVRPTGADARGCARRRQNVQAWCNGEPMVDKGSGRFEAATPIANEALVALRLVPPTGFSGGAAIPEAITIETNDQGIMSLGDWSKVGVLNTYSGGVRYRTTFTVTAEEADGRMGLDLDRVVATAEVSVNGKTAGVRVAPPWTFELTGLVQPGENVLEVLVYNTLANHYQTIPSLYRGDPVSGLFGPVRIMTTGNQKEQQ